MSGSLSEAFASVGVVAPDLEMAPAAVTVEALPTFDPKGDVPIPAAVPAQVTPATQQPVAPSPMAAAIVVAPTPPPVAPSGNQPEEPFSLATFMKEVAAFGQQEGKGANARPSFMLRVTQAAMLGAVKEDDATALHEAYQRNVAKSKGIAVVKQSSAPQQISKIKTMIKLGQLPLKDGGGEQILYRVGHAIKEATKANGDKPLSKSVVDCYLSAARQQLNTPEQPLSDDDIIAAVMPKPRDEALEVDKLGALRDRAQALIEDTDTPPSEETQRVLERITAECDARIEELGGTSKQRKQQEAAERKAEKAAQKAEKAQAELRALRAPLAMGVANYSSRG